MSWNTKHSWAAEAVMAFCVFPFEELDANDSLWAKGALRGIVELMIELLFLRSVILPVSPPSQDTNVYVHRTLWTAACANLLIAFVLTSLEIWGVTVLAQLPREVLLFSACGFLTQVGTTLAPFSPCSCSPQWLPKHVTEINFGGFFLCINHFDGEEEISVMASFYRGGRTAAQLSEPVILPAVFEIECLIWARAMT